MVNIGYRPTFEESQYWVEAYLFDFAGDLYDRTLTLDFLVRIRRRDEVPGGGGPHRAGPGRHGGGAAAAPGAAGGVIA